MVRLKIVKGYIYILQYEKLFHLAIVVFRSASSEKRFRYVFQRESNVTNKHDGNTSSSFSRP